MKWNLGIWLILVLMPLCTYGQDEFDTRDYTWMQTLIDSIETSDLCISCDIRPSINVYYTRGYYTPPRTLRFRLYYACDKQSSVTKYFEKDGSIAGVCIVDSTSRDCMDDITALTYTFGLDIQTVWSCDYGYSCNSAPHSILFPPYEVEVSNDLCDPKSRILRTSESFVSQQWLGPDDYSSSDESVQVRSSGVYHSIVQNELGCYDTVTVEVDLDGTITSDIDGPDIICGTEPICISTDGFSAYLWSTGDTTASICIDRPGRYTVQLTNNAGCTDTVEKMIRDGRDSYVAIGGHQDPVYMGQSVHLCYDLHGLQDEEILQVHWVIDDQRYTQLGPIEIRIEDETHISIELESLSGCVYTDQIWIDPLPVNKQVYFANAFNPYSEKGNERFYPQIVRGTIEVKRFSIFDRWGNEVYHSTAMNSAHENYGWDGRFNNQLLPTGSYLYMAEVTYADGSSDMRSGTVLLMY